MELLDKLESIQAQVETTIARMKSNTPAHVAPQARQSGVLVEYSPRYAGQPGTEEKNELPATSAAGSTHEVSTVHEYNPIASAREKGWSEFQNLMKKDRLPASGIRRARELIELYAYDKAKWYVSLQYKVNYQNQRDSQVKGYSMWKDTYGDWKNVGDEMCNLSSLGMAMLYMGITKDDVIGKLKAWGYKGKLPQQYDDLLELLRHEMAKTKAGYAKNPETTFRRDMNTTLKAIAQSFGLKVELDTKIGKRDATWYQVNILTELQKGNAAIISYNGHIVRIQDITAEGIVVDDPFGKVKIKPGNAIEIPWDGKTNNAKDSSRITGEDRLLPWSEVEKHSMYWIEIFKWK